MEIPYLPGLGCYAQIYAAVYKIMSGPQNSFSLTEALGKVARFPPYLFILCVEILGNAIGNCDQIKGFCVLDAKCKKVDTQMILL